MVVSAEGRFLSEEELGRLRDWSTGLSDRLEVARRVHAREVRILGRCIEALREEVAGFPNGKELAGFPNGKELPETGRGDAAEVVQGNIRLVLRYAVSGHVRDDLIWFEETVADFFAELMTSTSPPETVLRTMRILRDVVRDVLDGGEQRVLTPYIDIFVRECERWNEA